MGNGVEIVKTLVSPAKKLIDGMFKTFGKMYEPRHLKKMADAQSYQIKKIGEAMRENSDIPIEYNSNGISLSNTDYDEFVKRTQGRLAFEELRKQENIETVAGKALNLLDGKPSIESEEADPDWLLRFFNSVEDISNEEMQDIWAMLLAGEIQQPGAYSLRTLEALRNLSPQEAKIFQEISKHCLCSDGGASLIINNAEILKKELIPYGKIMLLEECGLVNGNGLLLLTEKISKNRKALLWNDNYTIIAYSHDEEIDVSFNIYPLTQIGKELMRIIGYSMDKQETIDIANGLSKQYNNVEIEVHSIVEMTETNIRYNNENLLKKE